VRDDNKEGTEKAKRASYDVMNISPAYLYQGYLRPAQVMSNCRHITYR